MEFQVNLTIYFEENTNVGLKIFQEQNWTTIQYAERSRSETQWTQIKGEHEFQTEQHDLRQKHSPYLLLRHGEL